jgi:hypothetical protein
VTATPAYDFSTSERVSRESCDILVGIVACWKSGLMQENSEVSQARVAVSTRPTRTHPHPTTDVSTCAVTIGSRFFLVEKSHRACVTARWVDVGWSVIGLDVVGLRALLVCRTWLGGEFGRERTSGSFSWAYARHLVQGSYRGGDVMGRYERLS